MASGQVGGPSVGVDRWVDRLWRAIITIQGRFLWQLWILSNIFSTD